MSLPVARGKLIPDLRRALRLRHYSRRTEQAYMSWVKRFVRFAGMRHPRELGAAEVRAFLTSLAVDRGLAAATQNQAASALVFLYEHVLRQPLARMDVVRAKEPVRIPTVLTPQEVMLVLAELQAVHGLVASLLYGSGVRLREALRLRVKDVDLARREIALRDTKGERGRHTVLSQHSAERLGTHLRVIRGMHERDVRRRVRVPLPGAFREKITTRVA